MSVATSDDTAPEGYTTVHGYYRFTDIFYEWSRALPDCDLQEVRSLKAFIAYDAIVHPDHPLSTTKGGVELYLGTLPNGEKRLMFSSAQIEYIQYWLHAMKLTREPIALPSSEWLIQASDLQHVSSVVYKNGQEFKKAQKTIEKNNKKLKGTSTLLGTRRLNFDRARSFWQAQHGAWLAIDFEAWDRDHTVLLEFGYSSVQWRDGQKIEDKGHLIVEEHKKYFNTYVPNFREHYNFGTSVEVSRAEFKQRINGLITDLSKDKPLFLLFHDYHGDIDYLKSKAVQAPIDGFIIDLPETVPTKGLFVLDTRELFSALEGESFANQSKLERVCRLMGLKPEYLHNAGNDAHYTMLVAAEMISNEEIDTQRERRWPGRTDTTGVGGGPGVRVQFQQWEEESDISDTEGILGGWARTSNEAA
ncbi:hypothetical protein BDM02DRAFT_3089827 [Thelephora ganbajun]|uniref:Uncharacterized protein n=1 Tax=Thelephora ganbajun TaxID=370292 RepID=A0ACB6ZRU8_THEGA|nr:hypothetical protein BDM02DRAFT_3089827 [Thelephora ganbajun]